MLVLLRNVILRPYHHLDGLEGLPVVGGVVFCCHVVPRSPENPVPDSLVPLVVVLPVEVGRHAGVKPPARAVVGAAVSRGVHVIVTVGCREKLLVMVEVLVETYGIPSCSTVSADGEPVAQVFISHVELVVLCIFPDTLKVLQLNAQNHVFGLRQ